MRLAFDTDRKTPPVITHYGTDERFAIVHLGEATLIPAGFNAECAEELRMWAQALSNAADQCDPPQVSKSTQTAPTLGAPTTPAELEAYTRNHGVQPPAIEWGDIASSGTAFVAMLPLGRMPFHEAVARLITLSGQDPTAHTDEYKVSVEFTGSFQGQPFTLYDYKGDGKLHIGGTSALHAAELIDALTPLILDAEPTPYSATIRYDEFDGETHSYPARD